MFYKDIGKEFLDQNGGLSGEIMPDYLHLSRQGLRHLGQGDQGRSREARQVGQPTKRSRHSSGILLSSKDRVPLFFDRHSPVKLYAVTGISGDWPRINPMHKVDLTILTLWGLGTATMIPAREFRRMNLKTANKVVLLAALGGAFRAARPSCRRETCCRHPPPHRNRWQKVSSR